MVKRSARGKSAAKTYIKKLYKKKKSTTVQLTRDVNEQELLGLSSRTIPRALAPRTKYVCLRYQEDMITLNPAASQWSNYQFAANGTYDPNLTGTGHQPMGLDYYNVFYLFNSVWKSVITVHFVNADSSYNSMVGIHTSRGTPAGSVCNPSIENGNTVFDIVTKANTGHSKSHVALTQTYTHREIFGDNIKPDDVAYQNSSSSNSSYLAYFNVFCDTMVNGVDGAGVQAYVTIDYYCIFSAPYEQAQN